MLQYTFSRNRAEHGIPAIMPKSKHHPHIRGVVGARATWRVVSPLTQKRARYMRVRTHEQLSDPMRHSKRARCSHPPHPSVSARRYSWTIQPFHSNATDWPPLGRTTAKNLRQTSASVVSSVDPISPTRELWGAVKDLGASTHLFPESRPVLSQSQWS